MGRIWRKQRIVGNKSIITDHKSYVHYRENAKVRNKKNTPHFVAYSGILTKIYKKIADSIVEYEGGVYANNFFYIIPQKVPVKKLITIPSKSGFKSTFNQHTDGYVYKIVYVNLLLKNECQPWDLLFTPKIKKKLKDKLRSMKVAYKFVLHSIMTSRRAR